MSARKGDWMQTATGGVFWPIDPRPDEVDIEDIAHALSNMCRYAGHVVDFYSVAQHSVLVSRYVPSAFALEGLLHDAAEAYVVDVPRPLKPFLAEYKGIESTVMDVIAQRFGIPKEMSPEVKRVDNAILGDEAAQIMRPPPRPWAFYEPPLGIEISPWSPSTARRMFLQRFDELIGR